ncbi:MAG: LptA/OstA family protein [Pseudomonadota bacterium]
MFRSTTPLALLLALLLVAGHATAQSSPFGGFKHDNSQPIEIVSDALEVRQAENLAIFSGNVRAGQGTLRLSADTLLVYYTQNGSDDTGTGAIRRLRAEGDVFLSNGSETAEGDWGDYDVIAGEIEMGVEAPGRQVVLTQGRNAVAGPSLTIDTNTGVGRIEGGRVKSVFTPADANADASDGN